MSDGPSCTVEELFKILTAPAGGMVLKPVEEYDTVLPNRLVIGDARVAKNRSLLKEIGITHMINCAYGPKDESHINFQPPVYSRVGIRAKNLPIDDDPRSDITEHFAEAIDFIDWSWKVDGKVMCVCTDGASRSAAIVLVALMHIEKMPIQEAMRTLRHVREVCPNDGFLQSLCDYNDKLVAEGHFNN